MSSFSPQMVRTSPYTDKEFSSSDGVAVEDILRARVRTCGVQEHRVRMIKNYIHIAHPHSSLSCLPDLESYGCTMSAVQNTNGVSVQCLFPTWGTLLILMSRSPAAWEPFFQDGTCGHHS